MMTYPCEYGVKIGLKTSESILVSLWSVGFFFSGHLTFTSIENIWDKVLPGYFCNISVR